MMGFELTTFGTYTLGRKQPLLKTLSHLGSYTLEINFIFLNNSKNYISHCNSLLRDTKNMLQERVV